MDSVRQFYDGFAHEYQSLFADWHQSVERQGRIIATFLNEIGYPAPAHVLDCTCGIGTQAIGLAGNGYRVMGEDLSPQSIKEAKNNAKKFSTDYPIQLAVADLLHPVTEHEDTYDIVLAYDNPIAHFQTDEALALAFENMLARLKSGGLLTTSLRDYDALSQQRPRHSHLGIQDKDDERQIIFQVWDWDDDGRRYRSEMFVIDRGEKATQIHSYITPFRAWKRAEVIHIIEQLGVSDITWHMPEASGYYQPILTARKS